MKILLELNQHEGELVFALLKEFAVERSQTAVMGQPSTSVPQSPVMETPTAIPVAPIEIPIQQNYQAIPVAAPQQQIVPEPVAQTQPMPVVPTTAATYTMEQLAVAATQIVDSGRRQELVNLLASFGVQALTQLPKEQYGAFATQLRAMGAKL